MSVTYKEVDLGVVKGEKGDPFTYKDFTAEQLAALKGNKGDSGVIVATQGQPTFAVENGELYVYIPQNSSNPYEVGEDGNLYITIPKIVDTEM